MVNRMAKSKYEDKKYPAMGLIKAGETNAAIAQKLEVPVSTITKWRKSVESIETKEDLAGFLNVDKEILHRIADHVKEELTEELDTPVAGELVDDIVTQMDEMQELNLELIQVGRKLTDKIRSMTRSIQNESELMVLVEALTKLQNAFFAKGANVNVLNVNGQTSDTGLSAFKSLQRSA